MTADKVCRICAAPVLAKSLCGPHYNRKLRDPALTDEQLAQPAKKGRPGPTEAQQAEVRRLHRSFVSRRDIATRTGLTPKQVSWILQPKERATR